MCLGYICMYKNKKEEVALMACHISSTRCCDAAESFATITCENRELCIHFVGKPCCEKEFLTYLNALVLIKSRHLAGSDPFFLLYRLDTIDLNKKNKRHIQAQESVLQGAHSCSIIVNSDLACKAIRTFILPKRTKTIIRTFTDLHKGQVWLKAQQRAIQ